MRIEKINENQIKCILTKEDLASRQIKISELAYGSEKTRELFHDMMEIAEADYGFEAGDIPLMIEAIPLSREKIALIVTKVESPEELDTRFSSFTDTGSDRDAAEGPKDEGPEDEPGYAQDLASQLLDLLENMRIGEPHTANGWGKKERPKLAPAFLYSFSDMEKAISVCRKIYMIYKGTSSLYKDERAGTYHLLIKQGDCPSGDFARINNLLCAYLTPERYSPAAVLVYEEHLKTIVKNNAVQMLAEL